VLPTATTNAKTCTYLRNPQNVEHVGKAVRLQQGGCNAGAYARFTVQSYRARAADEPPTSSNTRDDDGGGAGGAGYGGDGAATAARRWRWQW
jgi:hypothetical protein